MTVVTVVTVGTVVTVLIVVTVVSVMTVVTVVTVVIKERKGDERVVMKTKLWWISFCDEHKMLMKKFDW